jgi:hypothetical protein
MTMRQNLHNSFTLRNTYCDYIRGEMGEKWRQGAFFFVTEHHIMKAYWGSGGTVPRILWPRHEMEVSGELHALAAGNNKWLKISKIQKG